MYFKNAVPLSCQMLSSCNPQALLLLLLLLLSHVPMTRALGLPSLKRRSSGSTRIELADTRSQNCKLHTAKVTEFVRV